MTIIPLEQPKPASSEEIMDVLRKAMERASTSEVKSISISMHLTEGVYYTIDSFPRY